MWLVHQKHEIMSEIPTNTLEFLELCGRTCYKSENKICDGSAKRFTKMIVHDLKHESVIEHVNITVKFITSKSVTHELIRHRIASYSQESQRYINYKKKDLAFIIPVWSNIKSGFWQIRDIDIFLETDAEKNFVNSLFNAKLSYLFLLKEGWTPQQAREVLPNIIKTEIVMTTNLREWRHILKLRTSKAAHPQMRALMIPLLKEFQQKIPVIFDDIEINNEN